MGYEPSSDRISDAVNNFNAPSKSRRLQALTLLRYDSFRN